MNKEEYVANFNLEINNHIARITSKIDNEICEVWKINKNDILEILSFKENLIKYIEDKIEEEKKIQKFLYEKENTKLVEKATTNSAIRTYTDLLERIKNNNYENSKN